MVKDFILMSIFKEVQKEIKDKLKVDISIEDIQKMIEGQFSTIPDCFKKEEIIVLPYIGTFKIKKGRKEAIEYHRLLVSQGITPSEEKDLRYRLMKARTIQRVDFNNKNKVKSDESNIS